MGSFLLHRYEWVLALVSLLVLLSLRIDSGIKTAKTRAKYEDDPTYFKDAHQTNMIKEWVTSQYCKIDLDILCQETFFWQEGGSCQAAFNPPLRFVLDLDDNNNAKDSSSNNNNCSMASLISHTDWKERDSITDSDEDDTLIYFIAHLLEQVRTKSAKHFRAADRSISEFEQSRLIGIVLASLIDLFSTPTKLNTEGKTIATKATEFELTHHLWARGEVVSFVHDAVQFHTHHKRHGHSSEGAALRVSRQMPSFVFKFLPLVKEQIMELEMDAGLTTRLEKLYAFPQALESRQDLALHQDRPESDQCLWKHYEEDSLISQDCMLALETAPLKIRDLDWEGTFSFVLIQIFTWLSGAYMLWMVSHLRRKTFATRPLSARSMMAKSSRSILDVDYYSATDSSADVQWALKEEQTRARQKVCLGYLFLSCLIGWASSSSSETIQWSDFMDGISMALVGFISLHYRGPTPVIVGTSGRSQASLDRHYKKRASLLEEEAPDTA